MLALARSEQGAVPLRMEPVDLAEIARQAIADTVAFAASRRIEFELVAEAAVPVLGDALSLGLLVRNLADNAVRYGAAGTRVEVGVGVGVATDDAAGAGRGGGAQSGDSSGEARRGSVAVLRIDDAGPGIPEAERQRVFDRFYRRGDSVETGSGLGLAIVQNVATAHGAKVGLETSPAGGLRVSVRFPLLAVRPAGTPLLPMPTAETA